MSSLRSASLDSDPPSPAPTLDTVLAKLGEPGKYQVTSVRYFSYCNVLDRQVVLMLLLASNYIPVVVNHLLMAFYTGKVPFHCKVRI